jgi:hypothetical protein
MNIEFIMLILFYLFIKLYYNMNEQDKLNIINNVSNIKKVLLNLNNYCIKNNLIKPDLYISHLKNKKFMIKNNNNKIVHFGDIRYPDYTKHNDNKRRLSYLSRATKIKGDWKNDPFSPNNLSMYVLWNK